jgi:hypothetical protein
MLDMDAPTLEIAQTVARCIAEQLERSEMGNVTLPREMAELALAFTNAAIESLQSSPCDIRKSLN